MKTIELKQNVITMENDKEPILSTFNVTLIVFGLLTIAIASSVNWIMGEAPNETISMINNTCAVVSIITLAIILTILAFKNKQNNIKFDNYQHNHKNISNAINELSHHPATNTPDYYTTKFEYPTKIGGTTTAVVSPTVILEITRTSETAITLNYSYPTTGNTEVDTLTKTILNSIYTYNDYGHATKKDYKRLEKATENVLLTIADVKENILQPDVALTKLNTIQQKLNRTLTPELV